MMLGIALSVFGMPGSLLIAIVVVILALFSGFDMVGLATAVSIIVTALAVEGLSIAVRRNPYKVSARGRGAAAAILATTVLVCLLTPFIYGLGAVLGILLGSLLGVIYGELTTQKNAVHFLKVNGSVLAKELVCMAFRGVASTAMVITTLVSIYS
jgi:hypothetical protein